MRRVTKLVTPERVVMLGAKGKAEALEALVERLAQSPAVGDRDALRRAILEREAIMSTGIGQGIAIPHARLASVTEFVGALGLSREGIAFGAFDDKPVHIVLMIAGPERHREYLQILASVTLALKRETNRRRLLEIGTSEAFAALVQETQGASS